MFLLRIGVFLTSLRFGSNFCPTLVAGKCGAARGRFRDSLESTKRARAVAPGDASPVVSLRAYRSTLSCVARRSSVPPSRTASRSARFHYLRRVGEVLLYLQRFHHVVETPPRPGTRTALTRRARAVACAVSVYRLIEPEHASEALCVS